MRIHRKDADSNAKRKAWLVARKLVDCSFCKYHRHENQNAEDYRHAKSRKRNKGKTIDRTSIRYAVPI